MQIWHMEAFPCGDRRLPHHVFPPKKISPDQLMTLTGVQYFKVCLSTTKCHFIGGRGSVKPGLFPFLLSFWNGWFKSFNRLFYPYLLEDDFQVDLDDTVQMKKRLSRVKAEKNVGPSDIFVINNSVADLNDKVWKLAFACKNGYSWRNYMSQLWRKTMSFL